MKTQTDYDTLKTNITEKAKTAADYLVAANDIRLLPGNAHNAWSNEKTCLLVAGKPMNATPLAHEQLAEIAGIPSRYYEKLERENPQLLCECVANGMVKNERTLMVRTHAATKGFLQQDVTAILSDCYRRLDNVELLPAIEAAQLPENIKFVSCGATDSRTYIKMVFPSIQQEVRRVGDVVQLGLSISNSEVGRGALQVETLLYELSCTNGAVFARSGLSTRRTHFGTRKGREDVRLCELPPIIPFDLTRDELTELGAAGALQSDAQFWHDNVTARINVIAQQSTLAQIVAKARDAQAARVDNNPIAAWKAFGELFGMRASEVDKARELFIAGGNYTLWGMSRAITEMCQAVESYERATELERVGADCIQMSRAMYNTIINATI